MNLEFNPDEKDFWKAIGVTEEDEKIFIHFKSLYMQELNDKFRTEKAKDKLNAFQLKRLALQLSSFSKMLQTGLEWFRGHAREDQLTVLLIAEIFATMESNKAHSQEFKHKKFRRIS